MYDVAEHTEVFPDPYDGNPWRFVWVRGGPRLSANDRKHIGRLIVHMSYREQTQEDFKGDSCEGRVTTKGKISGLGAFYGVAYNLHLETEDGSVDGCVLLCDNRSKSARKAALN